MAGLGLCGGIVAPATAANADVGMSHGELLVQVQGKAAAGSTAAGSGGSDGGAAVAAAVPLPTPPLPVLASSSSDGGSASSSAALKDSVWQNFSASVVLQFLGGEAGGGRVQTAANGAAATAEPSAAGNTAAVVEAPAACIKSAATSCIAWSVSCRSWRREAAGVPSLSSPHNSSIPAKAINC